MPKQHDTQPCIVGTTSEEGHCSMRVMHYIKPPYG